MKNLTILLFLLLFSQPVKSQWYLQYQSSGSFLNDVRFIDRYTGWACGDNIILKTTNGGTNWLQQNGHGFLTDIFPVNDSVVYACGYYVILKTTNGGINWFALREGPNFVPLLEGLWFNNENTGWFCGDRVAMRTTNGGSTFVDSQYVPNTLMDIHFKNNSIGVIAAWSKTYRTTNSGVSWYPVTLPTSLATPFAESLSFMGDTGWTVTQGKIVYKTTNYGVSWDSIANIPFGSGTSSYSIEFSSQQTGYSGGTNGTLFKTTDAGSSWQTNLVTGSGAFFSIFSFNDSIVWAVNGDLYNTITGGLTYVYNEPEDINHYLFQNYPNPFNSSTLIRFRINRKSFVRLRIFDISGKTMSVLSEQVLDPGEHSKVFDALGLSSGIYFYRLEATYSGISHFDTKKFMLIK
jgi:photosystem II stability/assembly factor-like uncharacterized protein